MASLPARNLRPRQIFVASHSRLIDNADDHGDEPIVEKMTRNRLAKLSPANATQWAKQSIAAIKDATAVNEQESILKFMERRPSEAGPSGSSPTTEGDNKPRKKMKRTQDTPPGVTPSQRDGAPGKAILAFSPWVWSA